jgi:mannosyltransferase
LRRCVLTLHKPSVALTVVGLTLLGAALRFGTLDVQSVWLDESTTMLLVHHSLGGMFSHLHYEETPPLYFVLAWLWTRIFGGGVLGFRSLSAVFGTATIPMMYYVGRQISSRAEISSRIGIWAATLTAISPAMYYYSQEARCYALLILLSAATLFFWLRVLQGRDGRSLALWAVMSALALLTHYYAIFMFIPQALLLIRKLGLRRMLPPIGLELITGLALLPLATSQNATYSEVLESTSAISRAAGAVKQFLVGLYGPLEVYSALLVGLIAAIAVVYLWRDAKTSGRALAIQIGIVGAAAVLLPFALPLIHIAGSSFEGRHLISAWVPFALLVAMGVSVARNRRVGTTLGLALCAISLAVIVGINAIPGYQRDNWRGVADALASRAPGVIVTPPEGLGPLSIYLPHLRKITAPQVSAKELEFVALRTKRTGRSPLPPVVPTSAPRGYRLIAVKRTETYAVSRFLASAPIVTSTRVLFGAEGEPKAELVLHN